MKYTIKFSEVRKPLPEQTEQAFRAKDRYNRKEKYSPSLRDLIEGAEEDLIEDPNDEQEKL